MKKILLLLLLSIPMSTYGQLTLAYGFSRLPGSYTSIAGGPGTVATGMPFAADDATQIGIPIGFTFSYCGATYTQLSANTNGWVSLTNTPAVLNSFYNVTAGDMFTLGGGIGFLMPYWDDLSAVITGSPTATGYYQTSGTSPNMVFTFQWGTPATPWHSYLGFGDATFQVKLYETSGVIEFVYGPGTFTIKTATIGIANNHTSDFRVLPDDVMAPSPSSLWYHLIDTVPPVNTIFEWAPPCPSPPPASTGTFTVCEGSVTTLSNTAGGGTWLSSSVSVATVGSSTGDVTGIAGGVVNITYRVSPGCFAVSTVTVSPLPDTIVGGANACEGATKTYSSASTGGTWSSSNTAVGTISSSGVFGGVTSGTTTLSYTFGSTGCSRTLDITVNSIPEISGNNWACLTDTTVLTSLIPGGTWSSSNTGRAIVDAYGNVTGVTLGSVIITYTAPSGCIDTFLMAVQVDCDVSVSGVQGSHFEINVFPQPNNGDFYLSVPVAGSFEVTISDVYGKTYLSKKYENVKTDRLHFNEGNNYPPGSYIIKMVVGDEISVARMTVVK